MEFVEGKCPKCGGELKVPGTLENIICMYCGDTILRTHLVIPLQEKKSDYEELEREVWSLWETKDSTMDEKVKELLELEAHNYVGNYVYSMSNMPKIVLDNMRLAFCFKDKTYAIEMEEYKRSTRDILVALDTVCLLRATESENTIKEATSILLMGIQNKIEQDPKLKSNGAKKSEFENIKFVLALFTIPMLQEQGLSIGMLLVNAIHDAWVEAYPKFTFAIGTFADLNGGFKKKSFCYITTAVCETLNKPDDCYELTMFRQFRDRFLQKEEDGAALIQEYYEMAPNIIEHINQQDSKAAIYAQLWEGYLSTCLRKIEQGENAECKTLYVDMMQDLNLKWGQ